MLFEEGFTQNREISWLRYNERVLEEALDESVPLFERLRFVAIFVSNLEEFFKVRVGSLLGEDSEGDVIDKKSGMTAAQQLRRIHDLVPGLLIKKDMAYSIVESKLAEAGIERLEPWDLKDEDLAVCFDFFRDKISDRLSAKILDAEEPLPEMDEEKPYMIATLDAELEDKFGFIDMPDDLPKLMVMPGKDKLRYVLTEDIIKMFSDTLFVPFVPVEVFVMDIARNAEAAGGTADANTAGEMRAALRRRENTPADKLITDGRPGRALTEYFARNLDLDERQMFTTTRIDFSYIDELEELLPADLRAVLTYTPHVPKDQTALIPGSIMDAAKRKDLLSAYPYDSMDLFLGLLREASFSKDVKEIRITIYRLASNPKIADYLIYAARSGKTVKVILELRARFDEEKNLAWAKKLSAAGCRVYYGIDKYKVHSKMCLIVVEEKEDGKDGGRKNVKKYITQISTGNYNEKTAKQYTDISLITYDQEIGKAASRLFKDICKDRISAPDKNIRKEAEDRYAPLMVSPVSMRRRLLRLIKRETKKCKDGFIFMKMNSLTDEKFIEALMDASCAGCTVRLVVRGICCLLPGVEGCTENICIVNRVGRFLEHSRVYIFGKDQDEIMYISSADIMERNMDKRVEAACPVNDGKIKDRIRGLMLDVYCDMDKGRVMMPDGTYAKKKD
ncbi:MAG: polyphosphate kinase 1 [Mogibacterium sp.]|nr:polyphosphate kinase 1 [Mogibacterium sp.]